MTSIVVTDSDESALSTYVDELEALRPAWNVTAYTQGKDVLTHVSQTHTECVITNVKLQDMSGLELLQSLNDTYPDVVRFTLTSELEQEAVLQNAGVNHRFVDQSTPVSTQVDAIESSIQLHTILRTDALRQQIGNVTSLPSIPEIYREMVRELSSPLSTMHSVSRIIETDAALMASILKIVNSALYARTQKIESLTQAVALLGIHAIKNIALTTQLFSQFEGSDIDLNHLRALNDQANRTGALSNHFARLARLPRSMTDHVQLAGMLSNVGDLLTLSQQLDPKSTSSNLCSSSEMQGAYLLRLWLLPDPVIEAVAFQHDQIVIKIPKLTPLPILHAIRYLEANYTDPENTDQHASCQEYIQHFAGDELSETWTDAYNDLLLLTSHTDVKDSKAA